MDQMNTEIIEALDNCLNIDISHACFGVSYGILFDAEHLRKLFVNNDQQLYSDIEVDKKYVDEFTEGVLDEYHDEYLEYILRVFEPTVSGHRVNYKDDIIIDSKRGNVKSIIELYNLMKMLKAAGRIPENAYIGKVHWGDDD